MDEDLQAWREILEWSQSIALGETADSTKKYMAKSTTVGGSAYSDGLLSLYSNNRNPRWNINFVNMLPLTVSDLDLNQDVTEPIVLTFDVSFKYQYYTVTPTT